MYHAACTLFSFNHSNGRTHSRRFSTFYEIYFGVMFLICYTTGCIRVRGTIYMYRYTLLFTYGLYAAFAASIQQRKYTRLMNTIHSRSVHHLFNVRPPTHGPLDGVVVE